MPSDLFIASIENVSTLMYNNVPECDKESAVGGISEKEPIITYRETLKVINDLRRLLQVENINE